MLPKQGIVRSNTVAAILFVRSHQSDQSSRHISLTRFSCVLRIVQVMNWRSGVEKDLQEVLQSNTIFLNVSKGNVAAEKDLVAAFGTDDLNAIAQLILEKGELQVSAKEREHEADNKFKDIACVIAEKCINVETKRPFPVGTIEQCLRDIHFSIHLTKSAKQQALEAIRELEKTLPIQRASMRLRILLPTKVGKAVKAKLAPLWKTLEDEQFHAQHELVWRFFSWFSLLFLDVLLAFSLLGFILVH
jgi:ribosome maturation protein SDO1